MSWEDFLRALEGGESNGSSAKQHVDRGMDYLRQKQYNLALQEFNMMLSGLTRLTHERTTAVV